MFANWQPFLIHEKCLRMVITLHKKLYSFLVQLPILPLATPIFPTKVATLEASMRQCSSYSGHIHLQLLNRVMLLTMQLNIQLEHMIVP